MPPAERQAVQKEIDFRVQRAFAATERLTGINTQTVDINPPNPNIFPLWIMNAATNSNAGLVQSNSFPTWLTASVHNATVQCQVN